MMEIIFVLFLILAAWIGGMWVGAKIGWNARENSAKKFVAEYMKQVSDEARANTVHIVVTKVDTQFLVHDLNTGEFLAQGANHKQISKILGERFPSKTFVAKPDNLEEIGYSLDDAV